MNRNTRLALICFFSSLAVSHAQEEAKPLTPKVQMVEVEKDVRLEVSDWGGSGPNLVLLAGLGDNVHIFDAFALKLTAGCHVYGITRRGRGKSDKPPASEENYNVGRLGNDVLAVLDALQIKKPILAGHSLSGEELSYIGANYPTKVAGLIYLEAGYPYALYDQVHGNLELDVIALRKELVQFTNGYEYEPVKDYRGLIADLEQVENEVKLHETTVKDLSPTPVSPRMTPDLFAIVGAEERFKTIPVPALVIFGVGTNPAPQAVPTTSSEAIRQSLMVNSKDAQIAAWKRQVPSAHIVLIPHATHYVFESAPSETLHEMKSFIATLPAK